MPLWSEEEREFHHENSTKKHVAASAHKQRTHCGKGGCTLPSDFKTRKELKAMNGECVKYASLTKPMNWEEFKKLPDDLKKEYIDFMRDTFDVPDRYIAEMFNVHSVTLGKYFRILGLARTEKSNGRQKWDQHAFDVWRGAILELPEIPVVEHTFDPTETPVETVEEKNDVPVENKVEENQGSSCGHTKRKRAVPANGKMTFDGPIEDIVETLRMLLAGAEVTLDVAWTVIEPDPGVGMCKEE